MSTALILSGGGARGAFQAGVALALQELGIRFDMGFGVSAGALNISHVMHGSAGQLEKVWRGIRESDVHRTFGALKIGWRIGVQRKRGLYDNAPLRDLIREHIEPHPRARVGFVRLSDGAYSCEPATHETIYASATMPIVWEPVAGDLVDGGLRSQTPLSDAIDAGATRIVAVLCRPAGLRNQEYRPDGRLLFLGDTLRTTEILTDQIAEDDIRMTCMRNEQVLDGASRADSSGRPYRYVDLTVIRPDRWIGDTLSFDPAEIDEAIEHGYAVGMRTLTARVA